MRRLVAVMTCGKRGYKAKAIAQRETWVKALRARGTDVLFFVGRDAVVDCYDEITVDAPDDYSGIPLKVKAIMQWGTERKYDLISKCDDDVYVVPNRYAVLPLFPYNYIGRFRGPCGNYPAHFASGFFYTLSWYAACLVANTPWNGDWMDERFIANTLAYYGVGGNTDVNNYLCTGPFHKPADLLKLPKCYSGGTAYCQYGPQDMREMDRLFADAMPTAEHAQPLPAVPIAPVTLLRLQMQPMDCIPAEKLRRG